MRAFVIEHPQTASIRELPVPKIAAGEILVRVTAAGVNPIDWKNRDSYEGPFPKILGLDFAGLVVGVGEHVTRYVLDDRIFGMAGKHGSFAEYTVVAQDSSEGPNSKISEFVGDADAAALPVAGLTALASIEALGVKKGTVVLITAAAGGVGGFASQIAHLDVVVHPRIDARQSRSRGARPK
jgi:NADPH:quinone reductase-like Zn-dependent oxidoreductase